MSSRTQTLTRKIQIIPVGDKKEKERVYKYLRDGMYQQNKAYNILISNVYSAIYSGKSQAEINEIYKKGSRNPKEDDKSYSLYSYEDIKFPTGLGLAASIGYMVKADIKTAKSKGLFKGRIALPNKKADAPLRVESRFLNFYHNYENYQIFEEHLCKDNVDIYLNFVNGIVFKVILGNPYKSHELRSVFQNIFEEHYKVQGSSIQFDKSGKKIILNLALAIPINEEKLDESISVGVILGRDVPVVCTSNKSSAKAYIGSKEATTHTKAKLTEQRKRLQAAIRYTSGGHGTKRKLKPLDRLEKQESNFIRTQNHIISKKIIDFALEQNAKYINIGFPKADETADRSIVLSNWAVYQLKQYISYKAKLKGIEVRQVDTSEKHTECHACRCVTEKAAPPDFICSNGKCKLSTNTVDYDYNLCKNVALATEFVEATEEEK